MARSWFDALPQYTLGHQGRVQDINNALARSAYKDRLTLLGPSYGFGIGVNDCIRLAETAAHRLAVSE
eukprot:m.586043 g.586043  ORF g.586043 m.586043 type:complete len:68 (+) comp57973_c0_seq14:1-204(+)